MGSCDAGGAGSSLRKVINPITAENTALPAT